MNIAHVQALFSPEHGGPLYSLANWCRGQVKVGHDVSLYVLEGFPHASPAVRLPPPIKMHVCPVGFPAKLGRSPELRRLLRAEPTADIYHLHGVWMRAMHYGAVEARRRRRPYLVEIAGAYEPYPLSQKWPRKRLARWWFQDDLLRQAACLHVASAQEAEGLRRLGFKTPIAITPIGVNLDVLTPIPLGDAESGLLWPKLESHPFFLFLSRIHPKKGIELLLRTWAKLDQQFDDWRLVIAGTGDPEYVRQCQQAITEYGLDDKCVWAGPVNESQKSWLYANAGCYVLPSYSENFGNTVAEALAHGTPVITTLHTPWTGLPREGCGWIADTTEASLLATITEALETSAPRRREMGEAGRRLVEQRYSITSVIRQLDQVYTWLLGGPRPDEILF